MAENDDCESAGRAGARVHDEEWSEAVLAALKRAAKQAHLVAYQTGTGVVMRRNGKLVVVAPDPAMYEDPIPCANS